MENGRDEFFDLNFKKAISMYGNWIRSRCRLWSNTKFDFDDLWQESLLVVSHIVTHHSDLGIESRSFRNLLFRSLKNRHQDLTRRFKTQSRNIFLEVYYDSAIDDDRLAEAITLTSSPVRPDELIETIQLARELERRLDELDRKTLRMILDPSSELIKKAREHDRQTLQKVNRRTSGAKSEYQVAILASVLGSNYRSTLRSLERIRCTLSQILSES